MNEPQLQSKYKAIADKFEGKLKNIVIIQLEADGWCLDEDNMRNLDK